MSFTVSFKVAPDQTAPEAFDAADIPEAAVEAGGSLLNLGLEYADEIIGSVAQLTEGAHVSISGHWNGGYAPKEGWGPNFLTVSVTQVYNSDSSKG